ncbi:hypothetical protein [Rhodopirellula sp. MGV]|uniref:hypothetical protein n=1 Tax=Rhodopirellula sp. MGV TaxID=2023130 RepID=UPI000B95CE03|nr:hypothetical protein [Rhodopirellula sp. MGV]OYP28420.1 hypothetical protein CGZ80_26820 [Rhodopirellula sp. MGV]PNY38704.1 hypothetical protein C2E31_01960 [Rhodopirellula baltica]
MSWISVNMRNYFLALVTLILCACLYDESSRRLLAVPEIEVVKPKPPTNDASLRAELEDLFAEDEWELGNCKRVITKEMTLLFQECTQNTEGQWKLEPLTVVIGRGLTDNDTASPIVLKAPKGAELQFSQSLDLTTESTNGPPIKMGRMIGDVEIIRAGDLTDKQPLHVKTKDVWIDREKVWTTEEVDMALGAATMRGRDLTIYLAVSTTAASNVDSPSALLDRMNLVYLDELVVPLEQENYTDGPNETGKAKDDSLGGVISVTCNNRVSYDFSVDKLALYDRVSITRTVEGATLDRFDCDFVELTLLDPTNQQKQRSGPLDWIDSLRASGHPATLNLGSQEFMLEADLIDFNSVKGILQANSSEGVHLVRQNLRAYLRQLTYQYDPALPKNLGLIDVDGSGNVVIDDPDLAIKRLTWTDSFRLEPVTPTDIDAMRDGKADSKFDFRIVGHVRAELTDNGIASAGEIGGRLKSAPQIAAADAQKKTMSLQPEIFRAIQSVSIDTSQIAVATQQLSLYFEPAADLGRTPEQSGDTSFSKQLAVSQPATNNAIVQSNGPLGNLVGFAKSPQSDNLRQPVARPRPQISGDVISAQLLITDEGLEPKDISINGMVRVEHQVPAANGFLPVEMLGQTLRLIRGAATQSSGRDILQLGSGPDRPAQLKMEDGFFVGPTIKVWPSENRVEVNGAGEMKVPSSLLAKKSDTPDQDATNPKAIRWSEAPHCHWGTALEFDGVQAILHGGVQIDAAMESDEGPWRQRMTGQQMLIALSAPVKLMDKQSIQSTELQQISLYESPQEAVVVRAEQRDLNNEMKAIHVLTSRKLDFTPANGGHIVGTGPGWYRGWMLTDSQNSILSPKAAQTEHLGNQVLQGVHLTYRDSLQCDLKTETAEFVGGVRAGAKKVDRWDEIVDVNQMTRLAIGEMTLDCDRLGFGVSPNYPKDLLKIPGAVTPWELIADGGVIARSNTEAQGLFEVIANRASYQSLKSWLIIEGAPSRSAVIKRVLPNGAPGFHVNSPRVALNLKTYQAQTVIKDAQVSSLPIPSRQK